MIVTSTLEFRWVEPNLVLELDGSFGVYFNVSQLMKEPVGSTRTYETKDKVYPLGNGTDTQSVRGPVKLLRTDKGIWLSAQFQTETKCTCSRCLEEFSCAIQLTIEEEYFPTINTATGAWVNITPESEDNFRIGSDQILDASEATEQYIYLNHPMKPVCKNGCAGLCHNCGINLNRSNCKCNDNRVDSRWGPLLELKTVNEFSHKRNN